MAFDTMAPIKEVRRLTKDGVMWFSASKNSKCFYKVIPAGRTACSLRSDAILPKAWTV